MGVGGEEFEGTAKFCAITCDIIIPAQLSSLSFLKMMLAQGACISALLGTHQLTFSLSCGHYNANISGGSS